MPFKAVAGMRYEKTNVTANSLQKVPTSVVWVNPTEFDTNYAANATYSDVTDSYGEFLPNLDTSLQVRPDVLLRASYSKTIARSDLTQMVGTTSVTLTPKPGSRTATAGNPGLLPYESNNFDLSAEWYYTKDSYLSANWFVKRVTNFLTETTTQGPLFGITDPNAGAAEQKAVAELTAGRSSQRAEHLRPDVDGQSGTAQFLRSAGRPAGNLGHHDAYQRQQHQHPRLRAVGAARLLGQRLRCPGQLVRAERWCALECRRWSPRSSRWPA